MPCYVVKLPKEKSRFGWPDSTMIVCGRLGPHCECGGVTEILCDFPVGNGKTCDRKLCSSCSHLIGPDLHYCTAHHQQWRDFRESGGLVKELENVEPFKGR